MTQSAKTGEPISWVFQEQTALTVGENNPSPKFKCNPVQEEHMSMKVLTTSLAAFACAAVVAAQAPPPTQVPAPPTQAPAPAPAPTQRVPEARTAPAADNVTVMGCLERRAPGAIGTTGAAGAADAPAFILTKVMKPTGTAGSSSAAPPASTYRLDADEKKLSEHVGRKVEITGKVADRSAGASASKGGGSDLPQLKVDSVKMIASTCTE
jgi:hypothetical protein